MKMTECKVCKKSRNYTLKKCINCSDPGPYCQQCEFCTNCDEELPGDWSCGGMKVAHEIKEGEFKTKCSVCNDYIYCSNCVDICGCGQGPDHYVCEEGDHGCMGDEDGKCDERLCNNAAIECLCGDMRVYCKDHRPKIPESLKKEVLRQAIEAGEILMKN